MTNDVVSFHRK
ncbi:hypothetical protein DNTS_033277 [Danionella cerebrum]|uniref:Uncharacterized protein n=1 Tax=Danionella cerebrum TaxID=2873325 RepID=A0A553R2K0_9TELE|nr:hypothetical protein DNTS_033277 [Danionella translucida]